MTAGDPPAVPGMPSPPAQAAPAPAAASPSPTAPAAAPPAQAAAPPVALYVHIPFCLSVCPYCDFVVYGGATARGAGSRIPRFLLALRAELDLRADALDERWPAREPLATVYLGGGTPSLLPAAAIADLLAHVQRRFGLAAGAEVTLEANPGVDDRGDLAGFAAAGVNRISFGAQSLDARELRALGRRHAPRDVADAVLAARRAGITSINVDLLYDIPGGSASAWIRSLDAALALDLDHLSLYALTLDDPEAEGLTGTTGDHLPATAGARRWRDRARVRQDEDRAAEQYQLATDRLATAGFRGYEISNWARPGHESRHNLAYWERRPYEAAGPGAHAFDGAARRWTAARLDQYLEALLPPDGGPLLPPGGGETLDGPVSAAEAVILALRLDRGVPVGAGTRSPLAGQLDWAMAAGLLVHTGDDRLVLTTKGRLLSNELFARLL